MTLTPLSLSPSLPPYFSVSDSLCLSYNSRGLETEPRYHLNVSLYVKNPRHDTRLILHRKLQYKLTFRAYLQKKSITFTPFNATLKHTHTHISLGCSRAVSFHPPNSAEWSLINTIIATVLNHKTLINQWVQPGPLFENFHKISIFTPILKNTHTHL